MWKSLVLDLLIPSHIRIFLISTSNYATKFSLFMIKMIGFYHVLRQSYSKNSQGSYILKPILELKSNLSQLLINIPAEDIK